MSLVLGCKEYNTRIRNNKCIACGVKDQTNRELNSCSEKSCVKDARKLFLWTRSVMRKLTSHVAITYIGDYA